MPFKFILLCLICLLEVTPVQVYGQFKKVSITRAVIIGVSDYQDNQIPDLRFANKDAIAYAEYLQSKAGGSVAPDQIQLLTDSSATCGNVHKALNWLVDNSKENDKAIIYFSGHGDVETINNQEAGHFLLYNTSSSIYQLCSVKIEHLRKIVRELTIEKNTKVVVITDACRSGKLAGEGVNGSQATASALLSQFGNEIKIMSCQPNEFSLEGEQWGGGRGAFSYYLLNGLYGLADIDTDQLVSLGEIDNYLESEVGLAVKPLNQTPFASGDKKTIISVVDKDALAQAPDKSSLASVSSNGGMGKSNNSIQVLFNEALEQKRFLSDSTNQPSASEIYETMLEVPSLKPAMQGIRGDLIAALQDEVQKSIQAYLKSDNDELLKRWTYQESKYKRYSDYMQLAADLIGKDHYLYRQMIAKKYYFDAVNNRLQIENARKDPSFLEEARQHIEKALLYEERAAYLYNELGLILMLTNNDMCVDLFHRAIEISPTWALPYNNLCSYYITKKDFTRARQFAEEALALQDNFYTPFYNLSKIAEADGMPDKSIGYLNMARQYWESPQIHNIYGLAYMAKGNLDSAEIHLTHAIEMDSSFAEAYSNLGVIFFRQDNREEAKKLYEKAIELKPILVDPHINLGWLYYLKGEKSNAEESYKTALKIEPENLTLRLNYGLLLLVNERLEEAEIQYRAITSRIDKGNIWGHYMLACVYAKQGKSLLALSSLEKAIESGFDDYELMSTDTDLTSLFQEDKFISLLKKIKPN